MRSAAAVSAPKGVEQQRLAIVEVVGECPCRALRLGGDAPERGCAKAFLPDDSPGRVDEVGAPLTEIDDFRHPSLPWPD
jgi:hypothetical protein